MYQFTDNINLNLFFRFDKKFIENMNWALLPRSSKAIFPVIASHCNQEGLAFPGERTIAILAGRSDKNVREGVKGLDGFPKIKVEHYITRRGRRSKRFHFGLPPIEKGRSFPFHKCIIEGGNWRELTPTAQALYPVMRFWGYFDYEAYEEADQKTEICDFDEVYKKRTFDYCEADIGKMAMQANIKSRTSMSEAFRNLEKHFMIESKGNHRWKVFLIPTHHWKRDYLNGQVLNAYKSEL